MNFDVYIPFDLLRMVIFGEAEGETVVGQIAVGLVVRNQLNDERQRFGRNWKEVILFPKRYSCFNEGSLRIESMLRFVDTFEPDKLYRQISWIMKGIIDNSITDDITHGANHYITRDLYVSQDCPAWAKRCSVMTRIGDHIFLREG